MSARKVADASCVLAFSAGAYDIYVGDSTVALLSNASFYHRQSAFMKYGWSGAPCLTPAAAMCEVPATNYPCPSPPSMPVTPDEPSPFPPMAPVDASCGRREPCSPQLVLLLLHLLHLLTAAASGHCFHEPRSVPRSHRPA
jgi:hypothetical protein